MPGRFGLAHPFFLARSAFLLVVAGLPAVACFQAAYVFEATLLARSERVQEKKDSNDRPDRIDKFVDRFSLEDPETIQAFTRARADLVWDRVHAPLWPEARSAAADGSGFGMLDAVLAMMHRPYNDVATDLRAAALGREAAPAPAGAVTVGWLVAILCTLLGACHAFVYVLVTPIFALDAVALPAPTAQRAGWPSGRLLVVGPPGAGKSTELARDPAVRIFDVATQAYIERRKQARPVPFERRMAAAAGVGRSVSWSWSPEEPPARAAAIGLDDAGWADRFDDSTLPAGEGAAFGVDHLDYRLEEPEFAAQTLKFLEHAIDRGPGTIRLVCDRDPVAWLQDSGAPSAVIDRWTRALQSFRRETVGVGGAPGAAPAEGTDDAMVNECRGVPRLVRLAEETTQRLARDESPTVERALDEFGSAAEPYYGALWQACTPDQRLALRQLADEGLVNPQNQAVVCGLMRAGLIVRDPFPRVMNESFRRFVLRTVSADQVSAWERRGVAVPWGSLEVAMMTVVVGLAGLLVVTQEQLLGAWIGFVPTLVPAAQRVWKMFAAVQSPAGPGDVAV